MKTLGRALAIFAVIFALLTNALPCGPAYVTPIFEYDSSPEDPYSNFAAGDLGIIKPSFHRPVLYAAYRYLNGGSFSPEEQAAMVQVWEADFDNKNYLDTSVTEAVQAWVEKRKEVAGKDEKTPDIYTDKGSGYEYFPNCAKNAFETATETLSDRVAAHGPSDPGVVSWLSEQDAVFANCSNGKQMPAQAPPGSPEWLQKDRAYQMAAASFYSLDYEDAKRRFREITQDMDSPWQQTADYLVARTLVRQASLTKDKEKAAGFYDEAEQWLAKFGSSKFADSAEKMMGLIKYRIHPKERLGELARSLMNSGNSNFRQDVIDYAWLMDRYEAEILTTEEKRKQDEANREEAKNNANRMSGAEYANRLNESNSAETSVNSAMNVVANAARSASSDYKYHHGAPKVNEDDIEISVYSDDGKENWSFYVRSDATDEDAIAAAEQISGQLSETIKNRIRDARRTGYSLRFSNSQQSGHEMYYGSEKMTLSLLPDYLRSDELTEWLYLYPIQDNEAFLYSLSKFKSTSSDLWLMTALSKADKNSSQLMTLLEAAKRISHSSPAFQTIAYHQSRLLLELGKKPEAKKLLDDTLTGGDPLTVSSRNQFMALRLKLADSFDEFLKYSLRKPFAFDFDGESGTIQQFIDEEKKWYDPKNSDNKTREQYDQEIEGHFKNELLWQDRQMFDTDTISIMNEHFPVSVLIDVERSPAIPDYLRERFATAIWTRAVLLEDYATAAKIAPELVKYHPEYGDSIAQINNAKTTLSRQNAILYFLLKNPILSPEIQDGMGRSREDYDGGEIELGNYFYSYDLWWCAPYESESEQTDSDAPKKRSPDPTFLTPAQNQAVKAEQAKLKAIGNAPKYLGDKVVAWTKRSPLDHRIPESLFIGYEANGMSKYGCADNTELHDEIGAYLKSRYPQSEWTQKIVKEEKGDQ